MKIWVDDMRPAPFGWIHCNTVNSTVELLQDVQKFGSLKAIEEISLDHDAGDFAHDGGGDYIKILDWIEFMKFRDVPKISIHTMNSVGRENMQRIIDKNRWNR